MTPEAKAREKIDQKLMQAGWLVQDFKKINLGAASGIAVREHPTDTGPADYVLYVNRIAVGVIEAKRDEAGENLTAHETQTERYAGATLKWRKDKAPLPFLFESTGQIIHFTDGRDPAPRAREIFHFFQPAEPLESGAALLARILTERRSRWETRQLAKFQAQGKTPPKDWQAKYPAPVAPDTAGLPKLPQGWVWASLDSLIDEGPQNGLYLPATRYGHGCPILRIDDFQIGWARSRDDLNLVDADVEMVATYALQAGDIVINRVNSMTHLGKSLVVSESLDGVLFESNMMRSRLSPAIDVEYVGLYLGSELGRKRLIQDAKWAVNQASINQQDVKRTPIPIPSFFEQQEISGSVISLLVAADAQEKAIGHSLKQSAAQRKNILQAAFAGQLVPQDPADEPASALLARIRAERAARTSGAVRGRGKKKEAA